MLRRKQVKNLDLDRSRLEHFRIYIFWGKDLHSI